MNDYICNLSFAIVLCSLFERWIEWRNLGSSVRSKWRMRREFFARPITITELILILQQWLIKLILVSNFSTNNYIYSLFIRENLSKTPIPPPFIACQIFSVRVRALDSFQMTWKKFYNNSNSRSRIFHSNNKIIFIPNNYIYVFIRENLNKTPIPSPFIAHRIQIFSVRMRSVKSYFDG